MIRRYQNLSLKYKIIIPFCIALVVFSAAFYWYGTYSVQNTVIDNMANSNGLVLEQLSENFAFMRREVEDMTTQLIIQPIVQEYLQPSSSDAAKPYVSMDVRNAVNLIATKEYVTELAIQGFHNNTVPLLRGVDARFAFPQREQLEETPLYQDVIKANGKPIWTDSREDIALFTTDDSACLMMLRLIKDYESYGDLGLMALVINQRGLRTIFSKAMDNEECSVLMWNSQGELLSSYGKALSAGTDTQRSVRESWMDGQYSILGLEGNQFLFSHVRDDQMNWQLSYGVHLSRLLEPAKTTGRYLILFVMVATVLFAFMFAFLTSVVTRPAKKLLNAMEKFQEGDFETQLRFRYRDDFGKLGQGFNEMVAHIRELIARVYVLRIKEREAELTALQSQINPHFLYNTLDSIYWKAARNDQKEIAEMVLLLSNLFRTSLNKGKRFVPVRDEFLFLEHYLRLQKLRYGSKICYETTLSPEAAEVEIPKLILQPFVENAVYHGLEQKTGMGTVRVSCTVEERFLKAVIQDDGAGMEEAKARELEMGECQQENRLGGYSIRNVRERLELVYGESFSIQVQSSPGGGTTICLKMPTERMNLEEMDDSIADCR